MSYSSEVLADSPLLYLKFDETSGTTAADSSGNSRSGTHNNGVAVNQTSLLADGTGKAALYDGTNDYTVVPSGSWMGTTTLTVEARVRPNSGALSPPDACIIFGRDQATIGRVFNLGINASNKFQISVFIGGAQRLLAGTTTVVAGTTYSVAMRCNGASAALLVNGVVEASGTYSGALSNTTSNAFIVGNMELTLGDPNYAFDGYVDEVSWFGSALSDARLAAHHSAAISTGGASGTLSGSVGPVTGSLSGTSTLPSVSGTLAGNIGAITGALSGTTTAPSATGTLSGAIGAVTGSIAGTSSAPTAQTGVLAGTIGPITGEISADSLSGVTDTANYGNGRCRLGSGEDHSLYPVKPLPAHLTVTKHRIMAQQMPAPVLVDGKPT